MEYIERENKFLSDQFINYIWQNTNKFLPK